MDHARDVDSDVPSTSSSSRGGVGGGVSGLCGHRSTDASPRMRRLKFRARARSHTDLRRPDSRAGTGPDGLEAVSVRTEPSSPAKKALAGAGSKSVAAKRVQAVWASLKRFAPHKFRTKHHHKDERNHLHGASRLSASHPDVSCSDLAALACSSRDDLDGDLDDEDDDLDRGGGGGREALAEAPSVSDIDMNRARTLLTTSEPVKRAIFQPDVEVDVGNIDALDTGEASFSADYIPGVGTMESIMSRQKLRVLRQYAFFQLDVHLRCGKDLLAKDACGTSDPYVKFKVGGKQVHKSRTIHKTLDPVWDEFFVLPIEDVFQPVAIRVYDYDFGLQDDFMGQAVLDLTKLDLDRATDLVLPLSESGSPNEKPSKQWGKLMVTITLIPKTQEDKEQYFCKPSRSGAGGEAGAAASKKQKTQIWDSVVTIVLVEGKDLLPMDENGLSDPYVKFRLGTEKYKSKSALKTLSPQWLEQFDLHMYPDQQRVLEITVWDKDFHGKDDFMGRCAIDLSILATEKTHRLWQELEDGAGAIFLLLTISGTMGTETISDLATIEPNPRQREALVSRYGFLRSMTNMKDIGHLVVKVFKAHGLAAADIGGKSDPFCVVELVNARLQTNTEYKTLSPEWNKIFTFQVKDIHSVLEVTVYDEDQNKKFEFLGKVAIPLFRVRNGEKKWYALKDKKLRSRAKGQILLELDVIHNPIRASVRTFNPKELKYMQQEQKFKRAVFMRNVSRVKMMAMDFIQIARFLNSCFLWESPVRSVLSFVVFLTVTYTFELYMVPIALLLLFLKNYVVQAIIGFSSLGREEEELENEEDDDDDDDREGKGGLGKKEEKKSLKERLQAVQEVTAMVQNVLGEIASVGERIKNTFNFTVPFLSWLAIIVLSVLAFFLYLIPMRYIIMLWGINKFTKRLRTPHAVPNNEVLDFLTRVPDNDEKIMHRELRVQPPQTLETERKKKKRS